MTDKRSLFRRPRGAVILALGLAAVLVASIYAYYLSITPHRSPKASVTSGPLEFSVELNRTDFLAGESVSVRIRAKNTANATIKLVWSEVHLWSDPEQIAYFDYSICDANGTEVFQWLRGVGAEAVIIERTLNPSEQLVNIHNWTQTTGYPDFTTVQKGNYLVKALLSDVALEFNGQRSTITLETPDVTITIR